MAGTDESSFQRAERSPDLLMRALLASKLAPVWLGLGLTIAWPLLVGLVHVVADATLGPAQVPFGPRWLAWNVVVNGALLGLLLAGHLYLHLGALTDLERVRPILPGSDADFERLVRDVPNPSVPVLLLATWIGIGGGLAVANFAPS